MVGPFLLSVLSGALSVMIVGYLFDYFNGGRIIPSRYRPAENPDDEHVQILVLGDIGRSPRMQYHGISAAHHGRKVDIVAYKGNIHGLWPVPMLTAQKPQDIRI